MSSFRHPGEPPRVVPSPMVAQYQALKAAHQDALLFFRMGDFYELFFDDAVAAAPALEIALTRRGRHGDEDIPMCGVPVHNAELYLHRLIRKGFKVAICEQMEAPAEARKRGGRSLVQRDVVRIVTPGTLTEDGLLEAGRNNFLLAVAILQAEVGLAWVDISTGAFVTEPCVAAALPAALARLAPSEVLVAERDAADAGFHDWAARGPVTLTRLPDRAVDSVRGERRLAAAFGLATSEALGAFGRAELAAAGALIDYLELTQKGLLPRLDRPRRQEPDGTLQIDAATRRNLELSQSMAGERAGSLLACVDRTVTAAGCRLLVERLAGPLTDVAAIRARLDQVDSLVADAARRDGSRDLLRRCPDLERALARLDLGRGGPRDLAAVAQAQRRAEGLMSLLDGEPALADIVRRLDPPLALADRLEQALVDQPPLLARDGGFVRAGASPPLDELRSLRDEGRRHIAALEQRYREAAGIASLKIRYNNQIGWFVEVPAAQRDRVPAGFVQRQSMAGATRFTSAELADLEGRLAQAAERALALELGLFDELRGAIVDLAEPIRRVARALAEVDITAAFADLAVTRRWARPVIEDGDAFDVRGGRHPIVEEALNAAGQSFVGNDCDLSGEQRLWLLTGPNMAGKSTFLRQNALIAVLAQTGSFVPATSARIGVLDRLFSRVGAGDDLARGRSTFMVEMVETAAILNQATGRSLVILDEIGRGTATYDGLSLAWAVVEQLHEVNRCRALFATHYHELTALAAKLPRLACHTLRVKEWQGDVVFLHEVAPGTADRSYGVHVARLAGLPPAVVARAEQVLGRLESGEARSPTARLADDLPLFAAAAVPPPAPPEQPEALRLLADADPDQLSPRAALELLYRLKRATV